MSTRYTCLWAMKNGSWTSMFDQWYGNGKSIAVLEIAILNSIYNIKSEFVMNVAMRTITIYKNILENVYFVEPLFCDLWNYRIVLGHLD